jgi:hypothetical protein
MSTPEALILAALTMFALAAVWSIGVHEHRARRRFPPRKFKDTS